MSEKYYSASLVKGILDALGYWRTKCLKAEQELKDIHALTKLKIKD